MSSLPERLREAQEEVAERCRQTRAESERRRGEPPGPGEVFVFPETAELDVLWTVIDEAPGDPPRLLVVAADLHPSVGTTDVAVPHESSSGALSLRCACALWLTSPAFDGVKRTGNVDSEILERARSKRRAIEAGSLRGGAFEQEVDAEPDYQDWLEELARARKALAASHAETGRAEEASAEPSSVRPVDGEPLDFRLPSGRRFDRFYGLAASILLAVTLGLTGFLIRQGRIIADQAHEEERRAAVHREEVARLEEELEARGLSAPAVNFPVLWLYPTERQRSEGVFSEEETLRVPSTVDLLVLLLWVEESYPEYRLSIEQKETDREVWSRGGLMKNQAHEVRVALPSELLIAGDYWFSLYGVGSDQAVLVGEYALRVEILKSGRE